jgi:hypothetical protein
LRRHVYRLGPIERTGAALIISAVVGLRTLPALAYTIGITNVSGEQGNSCGACHAGGVAPAVHFEGPTQLAAGETATFRFVVESQAPAQQVAAGLDVAASAGKLASVSGQGERLLGGEITHTGPKANDANGMAAWEFTWQAPAQGGAATLFGAGNSVNLNGRNTGDRSATTTYQVVVADVASPTPTATDTPTEVPTPTPTATANVPLIPCIGDCDASGDVTVNELVVGVNIASGSVDLATCASFDSNQDGQVTINELLQAVNAALNGCPLSAGR